MKKEKNSVLLPNTARLGPVCQHHLKSGGSRVSATLHLLDVNEDQKITLKNVIFTLLRVLPVIDLVG
ncbi:MAG: hypothetical protein J5565_06975 [Muribaculaceae bacterium]|nr:hypothetical protein [Muribaculaceae bacterium]